MRADKEATGGITTGKPKVDPAGLTHICGVGSGNKPRTCCGGAPGHLPDGTSTACRSTGINAEAREPIMPEMPNLSPS
jgi:hypothetical protein